MYYTVIPLHQVCSTPSRQLACIQTARCCIMSLPIITTILCFSLTGHLHSVATLHVYVAVTLHVGLEISLLPPPPSKNFESNKQRLFNIDKQNNNLYV